MCYMWHMFCTACVQGTTCVICDICFALHVYKVQHVFYVTHVLYFLCLMILPSICSISWFYVCYFKPLWLLLAPFYLQCFMKPIFGAARVLSATLSIVNSFLLNFICILYVFKYHWCLRSVLYFHMFCTNHVCTSRTWRTYCRIFVL